jgi:23S rRNA (cytosine1962-C5)-methyltransferase
MQFEVAPDFAASPAERLRQAFIAPEETNAFRQLHGAADGVPDVYVDRLGDWMLVQGESVPGEALLKPWIGSGVLGAGPRGVYFKRRLRQVRQVSSEEASPRLVQGEAAPERFVVRENGVEYGLGMGEGYSVGLFLDQRDNRRRLLTRHVAAGFPLYENPGSTPEVLNCFAYTCAFSVCAALGGARSTSLDLSRNYLDWGRDQFRRNGLDPAAHDFIYGDVFDWLKRLAKKTRRFDVVLLDPPTFSRSREHGDFRAESDYGHLVALALPLLRPGGVLLASTNAARLTPERFLAQVQEAIEGAGRRILQEHYVPQPPDFPVHREEPAYLKTVWVRC